MFGIVVYSCLLELCTSTISLITFVQHFTDGIFVQKSTGFLKLYFFHFTHYSLYQSSNQLSLHFYTAENILPPNSNFHPKLRHKSSSELKTPVGFRPTLVTFVQKALLLLSLHLSDR